MEEARSRSKMKEGVVGGSGSGVGSGGGRQEISIVLHVGNDL